MLSIDREFADQIPPLTEEEFAQLEENILLEGTVLMPLIVWNGVIVDGHNRYKIIQAHPELQYSTYEKSFPDRNAALAWICKNQLGRRNLTPEQKKYLIGKQYGAEKAAHGGSRGTKRDQATGEFTASYENHNLRSTGKTCDKIAKENHVGRDYVIKAGRYADGIDAADQVEPGIRQEIFSGAICPVESAVQAVALASPEERAALVKRLRSPEVQRRRKRSPETEQDRIVRQVAADMNATESRHIVDENSMLGSLRGVANTMIRGCNRCFEMFPTLLTEQAYRRQVVEILQEPKAYILELENGGQGVSSITAISRETTVDARPEVLPPQAASSRKTNLAIMREIGRNMETSRATMTEEDVLYELRDAAATLIDRWNLCRSQNPELITHRECNEGVRQQVTEISNYLNQVGGNLPPL